MKKIFKIVVVFLFSGLITACASFSATSLRCGTDADSSYVEVVSAPQSLSQNTRALSELCAFAYDREIHDEAS